MAAFFITLVHSEHLQKSRVNAPPCGGIAVLSCLTNVLYCDNELIPQ